MRKRSKYRPRPVMRDPVGWVVDGLRPVSAAAETRTTQQSDVIRMAREAGSVSAEFMPDDFKGLLGVFERFAQLVAAHERNECEMVCDSLKSMINVNGQNGLYAECARAIRSRK